MTEGSGGRLRNAAESGLGDANAVNVPQWSAGSRGAVFGGDGTGHAAVPHGKAFDLTELTLTVIAKRLVSPSESDMIAGRPVSTSPTDVPFRMLFISGSLAFDYITSGTPVRTSTSSALHVNDEWFVVSGAIGKVTETQYRATLYSSGEFLSNSAAAITAPPARISPFFIGAENNRRFFNGKIDGVWLHSKWLNTQTGQIQELHDDPFAMFRPRTRSYFAFFADGAPPDPPTAPRRRQQPQLIGCGVI